MDSLEEWNSTVRSESELMQDVRTFGSIGGAPESVFDLMNTLVNLSVGGSSGCNPGKENKNKEGKSTRRRPKIPVLDRFMPTKGSVDLSHYMHQQAQSSSAANPKQKKSRIYSKALTETVFGVSDVKTLRVLNYGPEKKPNQKKYRNALKDICKGVCLQSTVAVESAFRIYCQSPDRVLDAPDILNDTSLNLVDWSKENIVAIALQDQVYLWTAHTAEIQRIPTEESREYVSCVGWLDDSSHLICATDRGKIQIWDIEYTKLVRSLSTMEQQRIGAMSFRSHIITGGNRTGALRHHDVRADKHEISRTDNAHRNEICSIKWSPDARLCATGGKDKIVRLWNSINMGSNLKPVCSLTEHKGPVRALCWAPRYSSVLATGGDRTIKVWKASNGTLLKSIDVESEITSLVWNQEYQEMFSGHGDNMLKLWRYPTMGNVGDILGHSKRILKMVLSPDETTVATVSADETLRFWKIFPASKHAKYSKDNSSSQLILTGLKGIR